MKYMLAQSGTRQKWDYIRKYEIIDFTAKSRFWILNITRSSAVASILKL